MSVLLNQTSRNNAAYTSNVTRYICIGDANLSAGNTTESSAQQVWRTGGTFSNLWCLVSANTLAVASSWVVRTRKGAVNGNQVVTYGSSATGTQEDVTNTDAVTAGDLWNYSGVTATDAGHQVTVQSVAMLFTATSNTVKRFGQGGGTTINSDNNTFFASLSYDGQGANTTEINVSQGFSTAGTLKNAMVKPASNARTTSTAFHSRKNTSGNGNLTMSVTAGSTTVQEDTSNTDAVSVNDTWNWSIVYQSDGTNHTGQWFLSLDFSTTDGTGMYFWGQNSTGKVQTAGTTLYQAVQGGNVSATETDVQVKGNVAGTVSHLTIFISANSIVSASTLNFEIAAATAGNQTVSITALTTGQFTDASNTDLLTTSTLINHKLVCPSTVTSITYFWLGMKMAVTQAASGGLFLISNMSGLQTGGPFFANPIG